MDREEIISKVQDIIVDKLGVDRNAVNEEANFEEDFGADSLDDIELLIEFEKHFGISIPDDEVDKIVTVKDAIDIIESKV